MSQPDLFVVCKNCGSEVSPYVTECPYCGQRVRKRAPKLERSAEDDMPRAKKARRPKLSRLRANEIEGIAPDTRPTATIALIAASLIVSLVFASEELGIEDLGAVAAPVFDQPWRYLTAPFVHGTSLGYAFVALTAVGVFGSLVERRFGALLMLLVFVVSGAAGVAAAVALGSVGEPFDYDFVFGANGAALGLLAAWWVDDRRAARAGDQRDNDLIGVLVFAGVLLLLPVAVLGANAVAGVTGALVGALLGLVLPTLTRR
ncbi:MAG: rhomboid family intramembrane serine protease [Thermoleophilaceae bacterium]|nr:rhomboid family intramembrane serine protease [Thermoleophilaceae bacterium]